MFYSLLIKEPTPISWNHWSIDHLHHICTPHIDQAPSESDQRVHNLPLILQDSNPVQPWSCALINSSRTPVAPLHPLHWSRASPSIPAWDPSQMTHWSVASPEEPFQPPSSPYPSPVQHAPETDSPPFSLFHPPTSTAGDVPCMANLHPW